MVDRSIGYDTAIGPAPGGGVDMARDGRACGGAELVRNRLLARSLVDTISMIGAPGGRVDFGKDVRAWAGEAVADGDSDVKAQELAIVYARVVGIDPGSISVVVAPTRAGSAYRFTILVTARTLAGDAVVALLGVSSSTVDDITQAGIGS